MVTDDLIYLITCAVNQETPDPERTAATNLDAVYDLAVRHQVAAAAAPALEAAGINDERFKYALDQSVLRNVTMDAEMVRVFARLSEAGIWHMPLKGIILQHYYPVRGMRQMGDHDILFDAGRAEDVKNIMESLGFRTVEFGVIHHDEYSKPPACFFEMHRELFGLQHDDKLYKYYKDIQNKLLGDGYEKHFSPEDFYLYVTAHDYKHYSNFGTGLRPLMDTYMILKNETFDMAYVAAEAEKLGIAEFESVNRSLAQHLFRGEKLTEKEQEMLDYILDSGVRGTLSHSVENEMARKEWSKARFFLERFFAPLNKNSSRYKSLTTRYPFFYKHRILLPFLLIYRPFRVIRTGRFGEMIKAIKNAKPR